MRIHLFVPEKTKKTDLDINRMNEYMGKDMTYVSKGRYAISKIVEKFVEQDEHARRGVFVPIYFCGSVYECLKELKINIYFYDIDLRDLNPSVESISHQIENHKNEVCCAIVPSLYGNPADLQEIEKVCSENNIKMIDDAAQSWGAKLEGRPVGTYGNAGVLACSPGKPTGGHMGSLFWCDESFLIHRTRHGLYHYLCYCVYCINRRDVYYNKKIIKAFGRILDWCLGFYLRTHSIENDRLELFEEPLMGGYFWDSLDFVDKRSSIHNSIKNHLKNQNQFQVISNIRGTGHPCKLVVRFYNADQCEEMKKYLDTCKISWWGGYQLLDRNTNQCPNAKIANNCILEIPIELNEEHMRYITDKIVQFCNARKDHV